MNNDIVSQAIVRLFKYERFYAEILLEMRRVISLRIPTAGVRIKDTIELFINPVFFESLSQDERVSVLRHECEHILRDHISRAKEIAPEVYSNPDAKIKTEEDAVNSTINMNKHRSLNMAMDCAINGNMANLPKEGVFPKAFDLPNGETMEWYLEQLKDNDKAKDFMEFDDHSLWAESDGDKEILKEKVRQAINKAAKRTRAAGCMTSDDELLVSKLNASASVNWRQQLKRFVAKSIECRIESSKKKRNRRYGIMFPGDVKTEDLHIGVAIDTSGSVSDEALSQFMKEIEQIHKYAKITVVEADAEIKNSYTFKPQKEYRISGRGGTAYKPAFDFFNEQEVDAVIYFGDMDTSDNDELVKPKYPVLWAIVGHQQQPANFGSSIEVKVK